MNTKQLRHFFVSNALLAVAIMSCGEKSIADDPSAGIADDSGIAQESQIQSTSPATPAQNVPAILQTPTVPTVSLGLVDTLPVTIGNTTYSTEAALSLGITDQARNLLYNAAKTNWLVTANLTGLDSIFSIQTVTIDIRSLNNSYDQKLTKPSTTVARRWLAEDPNLDQTTQWQVNTTVKISLYNQAGDQPYCALLKSQKIITPNPATTISLRDFTISVTTGSCSSTPTETITALSAKTKLAPGDSKQAVAVVMGTTGLQVISPQLWCWVGSKVSNGCGYRSSYSFYEWSAPPYCDCEVRFNTNGTVSSQKGLSGAILDVTRW